MSFCARSIAGIFFFLCVHVIHAQDVAQIYKAKRNTLKLGTVPIPTKIFISYEHAFTKHISLGGMVSYGGGNFLGYTCNIFTRYYFSAFDGNSWFVEARGSYGHYNQYVYSYSHNPNYPYNDATDYDGKHQSDIDYWNGGISGGYKVFCNERMFFEFLTGLHYGKATFGANDKYFDRSNVAGSFGSDKVQEVFKNSGPGFPLHFLINFGFEF